MLVVVDPNLTDESGHRLHYARMIVDLARPAEAVILAHRTFSTRQGADRSSDQELGGVVPLFRRRSVEGNTAERGLKKGVGKALNVLGPADRLLLPALRHAKRLVGRCWRDSTIADDLLAYLATAAATGSKDTDLFLASLEPDDAAGIVSRLGPSHHVARLTILLLQDPDQDRGGAVRLRDALRRAADLPRVTQICTDTPGLARAWRAALQTEVIELPVPLFVRLSLRAAPASEPLQLAYLGDARMEKGFDALPGLIAQIEPLWRTGRCRFVIQAHPGSRSDKARFNVTVDALRQFPPQAVDLVEGMLDNARYQSQLGRAAAVLAPFDPVSYKRRSSSIVTEALANAIPAVAPAATWMAEVIGEHCGVTYRGAGEMGQAIHRLVENYRHFWEETHAMAPRRRDIAAASEFARLLQLNREAAP